MTTDPIDAILASEAVEHAASAAASATAHAAAAGVAYEDLDEISALEAELLEDEVGIPPLYRAMRGVKVYVQQS